MARSAVPRPVPPSDKLKGLLDDLAEKAVQAVLSDAEATPRAMSDVLKVASGYWAVSRKGEDGEKEPSAWSKYHQAMTATDGKEENGKAH
jgi:hypothetical protein